MHYFVEESLQSKNSKKLTYILVQALRTLFQIGGGAKFFKKRQFQGRLKQHYLEQSPG